MMTAAITVMLLLVTVDSDLPPLPVPDRKVDYRVRRLYDPEVRKEPKRLSAAIDDVWKLLPPPDAKGQERAELARQLVGFITIRGSVDDPRMALVGRDVGWPVYSMLLHIGLPSVPALLDQLTFVPDDTPAGRNHREWVVRCLVEIYATGGDGRRIAVERIKLFAEDWPADSRKQILSVLDYTILKPSPSPADPLLKK